MRSEAIQKYVDNKIIKAFKENKSFNETTIILQEGIDRFNATISTRDNGVTYFILHNEFSEKRIQDMKMMEYLSSITNYGRTKTFELFKLREKMLGVDFQFKSLNENKEFPQRVL